MLVPIYGTKQAAECSYQELVKRSKEKGYERTNADFTLFKLWTKEDCLLVFAIHLFLPRYTCISLTFLGSNHTPLLISVSRSCHMSYTQRCIDSAPTDRAHTSDCSYQHQPSALQTRSITPISIPSHSSTQQRNSTQHSAL